MPLRNFILKISFACLAGFVAVSCLKDQVDDPVTGRDNGTVTLTINTDSSPYSRPVTRATADEEAVNPPMVLVFKGTGGTAVFSQAAKAAYHDNRTFVTLVTSSTECEIIFIANPPEDKYFDGASGTEKAFNETNLSATLQDKTVADIENLILTPRLISPRNTIRPFSQATDILPVSGRLQVPRIDIDTKLGDAQQKIALVRSLAKASVVVDPSLTGFTLEGAGAIKAPRNGSFYRFSSTLADNTSNLTELLTNSVVDGVSGMAPAVSNSTATNPLYIYEAKSDNGTALIIKAQYQGQSYYYKLDFFTGGAHFEIKRNFDYIFNIISAEAGYLDMNDAINGPAANIKYEITVVDNSGHDLISNGVYYLGVSNSRIEIYDRDALTLSQAVTVTTDARQEMGVTTATVTCAGGISLVSPSNSQLTLAPAAGSVGTTDISISVPASVTDATISLQVGTLTKEITVVRRPPMSFTGFLELAESDYVHCEIPGTPGNEWISVSPDGDNSENGTYTRPEPGKLYLLADLNMAESGATSRQGEVFVSRGDTGGPQGRTKVYIKQEPLNTGITGPDVPSRSYVGAFWRADQTGERLIRLFYESGAEGTWSAAVISGEDWIKLDTRPTDDTGVKWNSTESPADMNTHDQEYQVPGNARAVGGTMQATSNNYLYFRIGLKSKYTPTEDAPARYGLVLISYNNGQKYTPLYIRQGEGDDFLMRPTDPAPNGAIATRTKAVKYSPFNLTSQEYIDGTKTGGTSIAGHSQIGAKSGVFTEYPSQAGAYFQWASQNNPTYAWHPGNPSNAAEITGWSNAYPTTYWDALTTTHETCPNFYRRANDGSTSGPETSPTIADSEQRQSLWLNPETINTNNIENSVWGYLADGFFDRYNIVTPYNGWPYTAVATSSYKVSYIGRLFFNPLNNASIFFPAAGQRLVDTGALESLGAYGQYWNASAYSNHIGRRLFLTKTSAVSSDLSRDMAFPIRCVYDPTAIEYFIEVTPPTAQILTKGGTGSFTVKTNAPSWSYTITYSGGAGSSGWLNVTSGHAAGTAIPGSTAGTLVQYSAPINVSKAERYATITVTVADGSRSGTHKATQWYNIAEMFAKSNIVLRPDKTLDFATTQAENAEIPACMQGLQFRYGSLIGINANTTTATLSWDPSHAVFLPKEYPYDPWTYNYSLVPYHTSFTSSSVTDDFIYYYGPDGFNASSALGDICRYISKQEGWTKGKWRMPTSAELQLLNSGSKYKAKVTGTWSTQAFYNNPSSWKGMAVVVTGWWLGYETTGLMTSPPETTIFLPANGSRVNIGSMSNHGTLGGYWATSASTSSTCNYLYFSGTGSNVAVTTTGREYATGVRCILDH